MSGWDEWASVAVFHPETSEILKAMRFHEMLNLQLVQYSRYTPGKVIDLLDPKATTDTHLIVGGPTITGTTGRDTMYAGEKFIDVTFIGSSGADNIYGRTQGGAAIDSEVDYSASPGFIRIYVDAANLAGQIGFGGHAHGDTLQGIDDIVATRFNDSIDGTAEDNYYRGLDGADTLMGNAGEDTLDGGAGNDSLVGGSLQDRLIGGDGDDSLRGGGSEDALFGGAGNDTLRGQGEADVLWGDAGDDFLDGTENDQLSGGAGRDTLQGEGLTTLTGGADADVFSMMRGVRAVIQDFEIGRDDLVLGGPGAPTGLTGVAGLVPSMTQTNFNVVTIDYYGPSYQLTIEVHGSGVTVAALQNDITIF